jgi:hypothetical protein
MPIDKVEAESGEQKPHKRQRLRLIESYGAFSDDRLREVTEKIRDVTSSQSHQPVPTATHPDESLGVPSGDPSDEASTALLGIPIRRPIDIPNHSPDGSPNETSIQHETSIQQVHEPSSESSIEASHSVPHRHGSDHPVLLTENQAILYFCLQRIDGETTSLSRIARETAISEHTLKSCLKRLRAEQVIIYGGRRNCGGRIGFTAKVLARPIVLRGDKSRLTKKLQQIDYHALLFTETLEGTLHLDLQVEDVFHRMNHPMTPLLNSRMEEPMTHRSGHPQHQSMSGRLQKDLLQDLVLEGSFQDLNPRSLNPYLNQFDSAQGLQEFLDMANACIAASKEGHGKPIHNAHGFLFAQLKAGYINPPEGYKGRRVRAQEMRNRQLEAELATLRELKEREQQLRFELFQAELSPEDWERIEQEAQAKVNPHMGLTTKRQLEVHKDTILRQWFEERHVLP